MSRVLVDSGIDWIGKIPANWNIQPLGLYLKERKEKVSDIDYEPLSVTKNGIVPQLENAAKSDAHDQRKKVCKFDFVINSRSDRKQSCGLSYLEGSVSLINTVLKIYNYYPEYIKYALDNNMFSEEFYRNGHGIVADLWTTKYSEMKHIRIPEPNYDEQKNIANFLDKQCKKINEIINDNNHEIELLGEYKKTLITEVITSGLNKNSTFKESQIPWMGKIPSHYEVVTLKRLGTARNGLSYSPGEVADNGILVLRSSNIQNNKLSLNDNVYVKKEINEDLLLKENDLLICSRNGSKNLIGKNILINKDMEGQTFGAFMCVYRSKYNKYIRYVLNSHIFDYYLANFLTSTINQLTTSNLYSIKIPFTYNIEEQEKIIKYLDKQCSKLDSVIEYRKQIIEKLEEYKRSLIYECVTGKREV